VLGYGWFGLMAPVWPSGDIVVKLAREVNTIPADEATRRSILNLGLQPMSGSPRESGRFIDAEMYRWDRIIGAADIKVK
jgi:tripartite-type tricarboxylate transporter receptor subunit TctC